MRRFFTLVAALAAFAPCVVGTGTVSLRGRLLPDLPQHLEYAQQDISQGAIDRALAHLSLVLVDKPLRYNVTFNDVPSESRPACLTAFRQALRIWETAFPGEIRFVEAQPGESVDLTVVYEPDVRQNNNPVAGVVNWRRRITKGSPSTPELTAEIRLRTVQPNGRLMLPDHMRHTAAHELGHVLGLDDSPFFGDIMGPLDLKKPVDKFEASELENLRAMRAEAHRLRQTCKDHH